MCELKEHTHSLHFVVKLGINMVFDSQFHLMDLKVHQSQWNALIITPPLHMMTSSIVIAKNTNICFSTLFSLYNMM
jgi:hypothetical protein